MTAFLAALPLTAAVLLLCAVVWWRSGQTLDLVRNVGGAILETITHESLPAGYHVHEAVLDAGDLTDAELLAEVTRRKEDQP